MPRLRRRGHKVRSEERPVAEMTDAELGEANAYWQSVRGCKDEPAWWKAFALSIKVHDEQWRRFRLEARMGPMSESRIRLWATWQGQTAEYVADYARFHLRAATTQGQPEGLEVVEAVRSAHRECHGTVVGHGQPRMLRACLALRGIGPFGMGIVPC